MLWNKSLAQNLRENVRLALSDGPFDSQCIASCCYAFLGLFKWHIQTVSCLTVRFFFPLCCYSRRHREANAEENPWSGSWRQSLCETCYGIWQIHLKRLRLPRWITIPVLDPKHIWGKCSGTWCLGFFGFFNFQAALMINLGRSSVQTVDVFGPSAVSLTWGDEAPKSPEAQNVLLWIYLPM